MIFVAAVVVVVVEKLDGSLVPQHTIKQSVAFVVVLL